VIYFVIVNLVLWQHVVCYVRAGRCSVEAGCRQPASTECFKL